MVPLFSARSGSIRNSNRVLSEKQDERMLQLGRIKAKRSAPTLVGNLSGPVNHVKSARQTAVEVIDGVFDLVHEWGEAEAHGLRAGLSHGVSLGIRARLP